MTPLVIRVALSLVAAGSRSALAGSGGLAEAPAVVAAFDSRPRDECDIVLWLEINEPRNPAAASALGKEEPSLVSL